MIQPDNREKRSEGTPSPRLKAGGAPAHRALVIYAVALLLVVVAFIATQLVLEHATLDSPKYNQQALLLLVFTVFNFIILFGLAIVLTRNLVKLYFERKSRRLGSGFQVKLVSTFIAISVLQVGLMSFMAYGLISKSIERWFSVPAFEILEKAGDIAEHYYNTARDNQEYFSRLIIDSLQAREINHPSALAGLNEILPAEQVRYKLDRLEVYTPDLHTVFPKSTGPLDRPGPTIQSLLTDAFKGTPGHAEVRSKEGDRFYYAAPIYDEGRNVVIAVLLTQTHVPLSVSEIVSYLDATSGKYQALKQNRKIIRANYIVVLALTSLMILFCFAWFAVYISKRITRPVRALAEGAEQVAAGNLDHRIQCPANDELEILIESFNRMTRELKESKCRLDHTHQALQRTNVELEQRRRYIETVLQSIGTGVISIDREGIVRTMNQAAQRMLRLDGATVIGSNFKDVFSEPLHQEICQLMSRRNLLDSRGRDLALEIGQNVVHLAVALTPITDAPPHRRAGYVIVLDDLTDLIRAEKSAAWQEVARRLAHEIKNPLTPIQLSAERIQRRFAHLRAHNGAANGSPAPDDGGMDAYAATLEECIHTIVDESNSLRRLIDEFSRFARLPQASLMSCDLHTVIENALNLYQGRWGDVKVLSAFDARIPPMRLDPEQMKRVFVNLIDNALEAMADVPTKTLSLRTALNAEADTVTIEVADSGHGLPKRNRADLFLPYFSTRERGTGLGLAIVQQIVADHKGYIKALNNDLRGAKFVIELPVML